MMRPCIGVCALLLAISSCIGDDFIQDTVQENIRITTQIDSLAIGDDFQFEAVYTNQIGIVEALAVTWLSSDPGILAIDQSGLATGISTGPVDVIVEGTLPDKVLRDTRTVYVADTTVVQEPTVRTGVVRSTSSYTLQGNFELREEGDNLVLALDPSYRASSNLPGLYVYLSNNPNSVNGAYEIGAVQVFDGAHSFTIPGNDAGLFDFSHVLYYCKPFNVKVGDGAFSN